MSFLSAPFFASRERRPWRDTLGLTTGPMEALWPTWWRWFSARPWCAPRDGELTDLRAAVLDQGPGVDDGWEDDAEILSSRRQHARTAQAQAARFGPPPKDKHSQSYRQQQSHQTSFTAHHLPSSGTGWTDPRASKRRRLSRYQIRRHKDLLANDHDLVEWDGHDPKLILDADGRIVAVLLGRPEGENWDAVIAELERLLEGYGCAKHRQHRRGSYFSLADGVTKALGKRYGCCIHLDSKPGNLAHSKEYWQLLQLLTLNHSIRRIAGFQSTHHLPKLYKYYCDALGGLFEKRPELQQLFSNSILAAATWNLGPDVVTAEHEDGLNAPHGMCGVTSTSDYNHTLSGHIYLKQLKLAKLDTP
ncbi:hypothetical protein B0H10DRAFT_2103931 [Mycena sp. CBHHK59/15]|nr:hypothetical protein B0H10DRAFT_2103931 [Mycena sp. CBHHK59/15]